jgi:arabinofuranan 3-O-arabinosyltransferase
MVDCLQSLRARADFNRPYSFLAPWRLLAYGLVLLTAYAVFGLCFYRSGSWLVDQNGNPVLNDFTNAWIAGAQALHGQAPALYDPVQYSTLQEAVVGAAGAFYRNWPYPPTFFLVLAPFSALPYICAFIAWNVTTLSCCVVVVYVIVRRAAAIVPSLAFPFMPWNLVAGQNAFLTGSLLGAALLALERRPVLAGVFIGGLSIKPQFGILFPIALIASRQWRAFGSVAATIVLLAGISIAVFGTAAWAAFPRELLSQSADYLAVDWEAGPLAIGGWGRLQTVYGLMRYAHAGAAVAWLAQGVAAAGAAWVVWRVWRTSARYGLKAATLSAAALIAIPYAFAYDLAAAVIPAAFLVRDQIEHGLLPGEQMVMLFLFGTSLLIVSALGSIPLGPILILALISLVLRRSIGSAAAG